MGSSNPNAAAANQNGVMGLQETPVPPRPIWIDNPLRNRERHQVIKDAKKFHEEKHLEDIVDEGTFARAVLAAWGPNDIDDIEGLTRIERNALEGECTGTRWEKIKRLPRDFHIVLVTCCLAAVTQGWNQSSINGANLGWPKEFGLEVDLENPQTNPHDVWIFGIVNASTYLSAAFAGSWMTDPLNEHFYGRKGAIFIAGLFSFSTVIGAAYVRSWKTLLACRVLLGVGMGAKASVVPILLAEIAPRDIRGSLVISWQIFDAFGIFVGDAANLILFNSWRRMIAAAFVPAILMLLLIPFCTESPRWLLKKGKYQEALKAWICLHGAPTPLLACRDFYFTQVQLQNETRYIRRIDNRGSQPDPNDDAAAGTYQKDFTSTSFGTRIRQLYRVPRIRRAAVSAFVIMVAQQACGVNILAFLSSTIFNDVINAGGASPTKSHSSDPNAQKKALGMSLGFGLANFLFTYYAWRNIDSKGRRFLLNISFPNMFWTLLAAGACFHVKSEDARQGLIITLVLVFTLAYSVGEGPVAFTLSSEIFPTVNREVGMSFAVFWNLLGAGILALIVPILSHALTHTGLLGLFAGFNLIAWAGVFFLIPETALEGLEVINKKFEIHTGTHIRYRLETMKRFFGRRNTLGEPPIPLEEWARTHPHQ